MSSNGVRSRKASGKECEKAADATDNNELKSTIKSLRHEPLPTFPKQRIWTRMVVILSTLVVVYFTSSQDKVVHLARAKDDLSNRRQEIKCSPRYYSGVVNFPGCAPVMCGRIVMDFILTREETSRLLQFARQVISLTAENDAASAVVDLSSRMKSDESRDVFTWENKLLLSRIRRKIREVVTKSFKIETDKLNFMKPTLVSRLAASAVSSDKYWQPRADQDQHEGFHYSSTVFLSDSGEDVKGGRFIFDDPENVSTVVEPKAGRILTYTSGQENIRRVDRILSGELFMLTLPFTCDPRKAVDEEVK